MVATDPTPHAHEQNATLEQRLGLATDDQDGTTREHVLALLDADSRREDHAVPPVRTRHE